MFQKIGEVMIEQGYITNAQRVLSEFRKKETLTYDELRKELSDLTAKQIQAGISSLRNKGFKVITLPGYVGYRLEPAKWRVAVYFDREEDANEFAVQVGKLTSYKVEVGLDSPTSL